MEIGGIPAKSIPPLEGEGVDGGDEAGNLMYVADESVKGAMSS